MPTIKTIAAEIEKLKTRSRTWLIVLCVAVAVLAVLLWFLFQKSEGGSGHAQELKALDSVVKWQQATIDALEEASSAQDSLIKKSKTDYKQNRVIETRIIKEYEKIPAAVRSLDRERLRRELAED